MKGFQEFLYLKIILTISAVLFSKDLLKLALSENAEKMELKDFLREIKYVPESNSCGELFEYFTSQKIILPLWLMNMVERQES